MRTVNYIRKPFVDNVQKEVEGYSRCLDTDVDCTLFLPHVSARLRRVCVRRLTIRLDCRDEP